MTCLIVALMLAQAPESYTQKCVDYAFAKHSDCMRNCYANTKPSEPKPNCGQQCSAVQTRAMRYCMDTKGKYL